MSEWLVRFARETAVLFVESAPYLFVGFYLAGLLKVLVPESLIHRHLGGDRIKSVLLAALYGTPIPLCSCSVIPTAVALRKAGASKGATTSFLISTPETGVDSISVTWALLDPIMTIVRPIAAFITAVVTGGLVNVFVRRGWDGPAQDVAPERECSGGDEHDHGSTPAESEAGDASDSEAVRRPMHRFRDAARYAFGPLIDDLTPWFIIGFLISGLIATLAPTNLFTEIIPRGWPAMLLMLVAGTPMYICATASTPVAAALIAKGLEPGAALVFLLVGPATNITTLLVVSKMFGRRILSLYLVGIACLALVFGFGVNAAYGALGLDLSATVAEALEAGPVPWKIFASLAFLALLVVSAHRIGLIGAWSRKLSLLLRPLGLEPSSAITRGVLIVVVLLSWLSTGLTALQPGEAGFLLRFGRVVETRVEPGLIVHWPLPIERVEIGRPAEVRSTPLGYREQTGPLAASDRRRLDRESEMVCGDEALLTISYAVHWVVTDPWSARFRVVEPGALVRVCAEAAVRRVVASRESGELLVGHRTWLETEAAAVLQRDLDELEAGLGVVAVVLRDVHAPDEVHPAYRDVASAREDHERQMHEAEGFAAERLAQARAGALTRENRARGVGQRAIDGAAGRVASFVALAGEYERHAGLMRLRFFLEAAEQALRSSRNVFLVGEDVDVEIYDVGGQALSPALLPGDERGWTEDLEEDRR